MKIIQSINTFGGDNLTCGFRTSRALLAYMSQSYPVHKSLGVPYMLYTDDAGANLVADVIAPEEITVVDFRIIRYDTISYVGKFIVQQLQDTEYLHIDADATLHAMPETADVYCQSKRYANLGVEASKLKINCRGIEDIPCSSIVGFSDIEFKRAYISAVFSLIDSLPELYKISYETCWHIEEVLLQRMILDSNKSLAECPESHHQYFK